MRQWIFDMLSEVGMKHATAFLSYVLTFAAITAICLAVWLLARGITVRVAKAVIRRTKFKWDDIFFKNKVFHRASAVAVPATILAFAGNVAPYEGFLTKLGHTFGVFVTIMLVMSLIRSVNDIYSMYEVSKVRPIRGLLQVLQVAVYIVGAIVAVAILAGQSPLALLGGIGAMTAVITLIFKDAILGFVSGIQLTGNDMIRIGDWIEIPNLNANGFVTDLSMTTVKVENFDKSVTSIPAYTLISDAFINWRGMVASGGRRIKRAIYVDASDIRFCDAGMMERFGRMELLRDYIAEKSAELDEHNKVNAIDLSDPVNGQRLTNLGIFRIYIMRYLSRHPRICHEMPCMVRHLAPSEYGVPLEIYAFANTTAWVEYEPIQAELFDHLYAVVPEFGLRIYQKPSASDFRMLVRPCDTGEINSRHMDQISNTETPKDL